RRSSRTSTTSSSMPSGVAPSSTACTVSTGNSRFGNWSTPRRRKPSTPKTISASVIIQVRMGRRIETSESVTGAASADHGLGVVALQAGGRRGRDRLAGDVAHPARRAVDECALPAHDDAIADLEPAAHLDPPVADHAQLERAALDVAVAVQAEGDRTVRALQHRLLRDHRDALAHGDAE